MKKIMVFSLMAMLIPMVSLAANITPPKAKEYIELNHPLESGMETYPGLSEVKVFAKSPRFSNGALIDGITFLGISATYIDAPYHADEKGMKIGDYPLKKLVNLPIVVIEKPTDRRTFDVEDLSKFDVAGKAVLLHTGNDQLFGTAEYSKNPPYLSTAAAKWLVNHHAAFVGIDALLIDDYNKNDTIPVHDMLLKNGIVIAEDMTNIGSVVGKNAWLTAVPPRAPMTSFPTRIFAAVY